MTVSWRGVYPAAITHFYEDQSLDLDAMSGHLEAMISAGVHGLIVLGTVGENTSLEPHEKREVLQERGERRRWTSSRLAWSCGVQYGGSQLIRAGRRKAWC